ncbi:NADH-dependent flavin oxidoreductase [Diplodia intermedia]|uniref:NADH-dependent flavin oxidoreductase n=1 Tax=Diplodia intermedia TaxID=856260 RepID=A0ABR3T1D5_9PEZI
MSSHHAITEPIYCYHGLLNKAAPGVSYYTPLQSPPAGTALADDDKPIPKLFKPLQIRGLTLQNRIMLSPMCQYSAPDGHMTDWHFAHLGGIVKRGPGLSFCEATAVTPEGRITPEDVGLWQDSQIEPMRRIVEFVHSQGQHIGVQLGHAGRKASTVAPWLSSGDIATEEVHGWPDNVFAPSAIAYNDRHASPKEMTKTDIQNLKDAFVAAVKRGLAAGFDAVEIHGAHGYLLHSFASPVSNKRTDEYGGSFENRIRLTLEIVDLVRANIPDTMPLFLRVSSTDWLEQVDEFGPEKSWTVDDTARLAEIVADRGVDLLDVSSGGIHPKQKIIGGPAYQSPAAKKIKAKIGDKMLIGTVGAIPDAQTANSLLEEGALDLAIVGRGFLKDPFLVWTWAQDLGVEVNNPNQIRWGFHGRGRRTTRHPKEGGA